MEKKLLNGLSLSDFNYNMEINGGILFDEVVPEKLCAGVRSDAFVHYEKNRELQIAAGLEKKAQWGAHHICGRKDHIHDLLEADYLHPYLTDFFDGKPYILNSIGAAINAPAHMGNYEHGQKWHRDLRSYAGVGPRQMAIAMFMFDDFTTENGATEVLLGSHHSGRFPPDDFIRQNAKQVCGKKGSIILYDGDIWHRAGVNRTEQFRVGVTCLFTKPYYKQQLDYPRYLDKTYAESLSPRMRQLFGFNARVPASIEEWYNPGKRFYGTDQE